jgi:hypothetical protein
MRRLTAEEVRDIMSQDHLRNTAYAFGKAETDVTADDLISHWLNFHLMTVTQFLVTDDRDDHLFI